MYRFYTNIHPLFDIERHITFFIPNRPQTQLGCENEHALSLAKNESLGISWRGNIF